MSRTEIRQVVGISDGDKMYFGFLLTKCRYGDMRSDCARSISRRTSLESHLRDLLEQGLEVVAAKDATAAPRYPEWGYGYTAALINFRFFAQGVLSTGEVVKAMR